MQTSTVTKEQLNAFVEVHRAVADAIRELGSVPSGHLYASLMGNLSLEHYTSIIERLKRAGVIREENYLLIWNG